MSETAATRRSGKFGEDVTDGPVFVSYKSEDSQAVRAVVDLLRAAGLDVWFAEYEVLSSTYDDFTAELDDALRGAVAASSGAIVFSNARWADSVHCRNELDWIRERFGNGSEDVLHVRTPREDMRQLSAEQAKVLREYPAVEYPVDAEGAFVVASAILRQFAPRASLRSAPPCEEGPRLRFASNGYWGAVQLDGFVSDDSLGDALKRFDAQTPLRGSGRIRDVPLEIEVKLDPFESLLSPWELADHSEDGRVATAMIDDRAVYQRLRRAARDWLREQNLTEVALHLFWHRQMEPRPNREDGFSKRLGKTALTCLRQDGDCPRWERHYLLVVADPWSGAIGQIALSMSMPWQTPDRDRELSRFSSIAPRCDRIAETVAYLGRPRKSWSDVVLTGSVTAAVAVGLLALLLPGWPLWAKLGLGVALGLLRTPGILRQSPPMTTSFDEVPSRPREYRSEVHGYTLVVPLGWTVARGVGTAIQNRLGDVDVLLVPVGQKFPQLAVNVAVSSGPRRWSDDRMTREFAERTCAVTRAIGASSVGYDEIEIDGASAFELVYTRPFVGGKSTGFYKAGCFHQRRLFYFQGSCADLGRDVEMMRRIVGSIRIRSDGGSGAASDAQSVG